MYMSKSEIPEFVKLVAVVVVLFAIIFVSCSNEWNAAAETNNANEDQLVATYDCDYHTLSLKTYITTNYNGREVEISGNLVKLVTDPLTMKYRDSGEIIAYADDKYHILDQDTHNITVNDELEVCVDGDFNIIGESYTLYNAQGEYIGKATFSVWGYSGTIYDANDNIIATFSKNIIDDYTVYIYQNDVLSDESILMLTASYMSDAKYDSNNKSHRSNK